MVLKKIFVRLALIGLVLGFVFSCKQKKEVEKETIIARVGDKSISVNEFIRRAEYTFRPVWAHGDSYIERKVVLNSLIAEKLLALDDADSSRLLDNEDVQAYLQGRREQDMRQVYFYETAVKNTAVDSTILRTAVGMSERTYDIQMIPLESEVRAALINDRMKKGKLDFESAFYSVYPDTAKISELQVSWDSPISDVIYKKLFFETPQKGQVIGPLKLDTEKYAFIRIQGWTRHVIMGNTPYEQRTGDVSDKIREINSKQTYEQQVTDLMHGKRIAFNPNVFIKLVNAVGPQYFKSNEEKKESFNRQFWKDNKEKAVIDDIYSKIDEIRDQELYNVDGKSYTVDDFQKEIKIHPLVFRNPKMPKGEFGEQFKLAVVDMVRDRFITDEAYKMDLDKNPKVERNAQMWRDNLLALYKRHEILEDKNTKGFNRLKIVNTYLDPYLDSLRQVYSDKIYINTDAFEKTPLTSIDMFVIQHDVPFPVVTPGFPELTTHNLLDYGKKIVTGSM